MEKENKVEKINGIMGWLITLLVAFITALTYPITYFWFKGIADYYKIDLLYVYGNYGFAIGNILITIAVVILSLIISYLICKWIGETKEIWSKIGKGFIIFFTIIFINEILILSPYYKAISLEIVLASFAVAFFATCIECLVIIPNGVFLYKQMHKEENKKSALSFKYLIVFIIWLVVVCVASYSFSQGQIQKLKEYEIIKIDQVNKVIVAKYQDMFCTYNCEISNDELIIYTDKSKMIDMRDIEVEKIKFNKVTIE